MKFELKKITVDKLIAGYSAVNVDDDDVVGYGGKLSIRPAYQREFIYSPEQQKAVINSILNSFPLNVMYWVKTGDDKYELLDGQQRTVSIGNYCNGALSVKDKLFSSLTEDKKRHIKNYEVMVYICEGEDSEVLDWFEVINMVGLVLKPQEIRNAIYTCEWLASAKKYFSKRGCVAQDIASDYITGAANRQDYLQAAIKWHTNAKTDSDIRKYMAKRRDDDNPSADKLWDYFNRVIEWVKTTFPHKKKKPLYPKEMKGVEWGLLYNTHKKDSINADELAERIAKLMEDEDVDDKKGIFSYVLNGDEKHLNIRAFDDKQKREAYQRQKGICKICREEFDIEKMEADHIDPWSAGGKTAADNCQMLCKPCNRRKSNK